MICKSGIKFWTTPSEVEFASPGEAVWFDNEEWDDFATIDRLYDKLKTMDVVCATSWQHGLMTARGVGKRLFIVAPSVSGLIGFVGPKRADGKLRLVVTGTPTECMIVYGAVIALNSSSVQFSLKILSDSPRAAEAANEWCEVLPATDEAFKSACVDSHVLVSPRQKFTSYPVREIRAVSAGCSVVTPHHSAMREVLSEFASYYQPGRGSRYECEAVAGRLRALRSALDSIPPDAFFEYSRHDFEVFTSSHGTDGSIIDLAEVAALLGSYPLNG